MKHGPIALIDSDMPVVVIATHNAMYEKVLSNIQEIKARQGRVIALVSKGDDTIAKIADLLGVKVKYISSDQCNLYFRIYRENNQEICIFKKASQLFLKSQAQISVDHGNDRHAPSFHRVKLGPIGVKMFSSKSHL